MRRICVLIKNDLAGVSLHNLHIVSCRILRWEEGEDRSCACLYALHLSIKYFPGVGIHFYFHLLPWFDPLQLGFLVISSAPDAIKRDNRHERLSELNLIATS